MLTYVQAYACLSGRIVTSLGSEKRRAFTGADAPGPSHFLPVIGVGRVSSEGAQEKTMFQLKNRVSRKRLIAVFVLCGSVALIPALMRAGALPAEDILYIGDGGDNTIKRFGAESGLFLDGKNGSLVLPGSNGLRGPRGIIIDQSHGVDDLILVNQN